MFYSCEKFNSDLSRWDVSNVENMCCMFQNCKSFNSDLGEWDVSKVDDMQYMFDGCISMKGLPKWFHIPIQKNRKQNMKNLNVYIQENT